jgi:hypothetical protein
MQRLDFRTIQAIGLRKKETGQAMKHSTLTRGMIAGMVGGLAGTILMYLFGVGIFALLGWPASTSFSIIGDSAAAFFSRLGVALVGGASLGVRLYCLIGLALGATLGAAIVGLQPLYLASLKKRVGLSILYVEVMSLPLLAAGSLALKMSVADAVLWSGISVVMHLVYGLVLGMVTSYGMMIRKEEVWLKRKIG